MPRKIAVLIATATSLLLAGCATDPAAMVAGGAKSACKGSGSAPCTRPAPGNMNTTPAR